jgi:hypothetical protein
MEATSMDVRHFRARAEGSTAEVEAVCIGCGPDLVVVVGGGERYHVGAVALGLSLPSIRDPAKHTTSGYLVPVPGHREEDLAREGSLRLSRALQRNVVVTVGIHDDQIAKARIQEYVEAFRRLVDSIERAYAAPAPGAGGDPPRRA